LWRRRGLERTLSLRRDLRDDWLVIPFDETPYLPADRRALPQVVAARAALETLESSLVVSARRRGVSWGELGVDLGITPQGARQRHLAVDPVPRRPKRQSAMDAFYAGLDAAIAAREAPTPGVRR
jgi:hypothetical protein